MKNFFALALAVLFLLPLIVSCKTDADDESVSATEVSQPEQSAAEQSEETVSDSTEASVEESAETVIEKIDVTVFVNNFCNYYHEPFAAGDVINREDALQYVFEYLNGYMYNERPEWSEFIIKDEETFIMYVNGEELRIFAKILYGDDFDVMKYQSLYIGEGEPSFNEKYLEDSDTYVIPTNRGYWGGDNYYMAYGTKPTVTETDDEILVTAVITNENEMEGIVGDDADTKTLTYRFAKVVHRGVEHYRLIEITPAD